MAVLLYGRLLTVDATAARYAYGRDRSVWIEPDRADGIVVIPVAHPEDWYVEGTEQRLKPAAALVHKARKSFRTDGAWPEGVAFNA
ncbi:hypothetical protein ET445_01360 [Agromyces protaetiae]|uniref:Uncharacterized protein n=1 Tax=Agromyces protaetiae TaxID=2509455 RepID=A0A4P6F9F2_9MICO|nr:hypothetical protein [Agromyces protaetiae]QAY72186.1 hypothetical protein ET445_01360 [Agromyces protaetiae]